MADEIDRLDHETVALEALGQGVELSSARGTDIGDARAIEGEHHLDAEPVRTRGAGRGRRRDDRSTGRLIGPAGRRLARSLSEQILDLLHIGLGVAPLLLRVFVAGMHQLDLGAGGLLRRTLEAAFTAQCTGTLPKIRPQHHRFAHQWRVGRQRRCTPLHRDDKLLALGEGRLRERAPVVARVLVEADIQPALRLGEMVVRYAATAVVQSLDALLQCEIAVVIRLDHGIGDARLLRRELCVLRGRAERCGGECHRGEDGRDGTGKKGLHRSRLRLISRSEPLKRCSSNLKRRRR